MTRLVVLPGMDGTGHLLVDFVAALDVSIQATVIAYPPTESLNYAQLEARILPALPKSEPYFLLGESFGGPLAIALAARHPPGLLGLVLCASFARYPISALRAAAVLSRVAPTHTAPAAVLSWLLLGRWNTPALHAALKTSLASVSAAAMRTRLESALSVDASGLLRGVSVPVLYLRAAYDRIVPRAAGDQILRALPTATLVELAGPHFLLQALPVSCAAEVRRFVEVHSVD